jgi:hypothetical protein
MGIKTENSQTARCVTCASIGSQLGLAPAAEHAMRHSLAADYSRSKWLALANWKDERAPRSMRS